MTREYKVPGTGNLRLGMDTCRVGRSDLVALDIYREAAAMSNNLEEVMSMWSESLQILDRNECS